MLFDIGQYIQLLINPVTGLIKGGAEEHEQVADFKHGIVFNRTTAYFMESGCIHVYLRFVGNVYMRLAAQLATAHRMQWHTVHHACRLIILVNQTVNLTMFKKLLNLGVVSAFAGGIFENAKFETGAFDDFQRKQHQWRFLFPAVILRLHSFLGQILNVRNTVIRNCNIRHRQLHKVSDTTAESALKKKGIFGFLQNVGHIRCHYLLNFLIAEEERVIILFSQCLIPLFLSKASERRFQNLVILLQLIEESL